MSQLVWDEIGSRRFEFGVDRAILYLPNHTAIPWSGLTSIVEKSDISVNPVYFDGKKIADKVSLGDFSATMRAITYPEEFLELEGLLSVVDGLYVTEQMPQTFSLCYRTQYGSDVAQNAGYKIHFLYNLTAIPSQKNYSTVTNVENLTEFEWELSALPEDVSGARSTAHIIIDSQTTDPRHFLQLEEMIYGSEFVTPTFISVADLITFLETPYAITIDWVEDSGETMWVATASDVDRIEDEPLPPAGRFTIHDFSGGILPDGLFWITDTLEVSE